MLANLTDAGGRGFEDRVIHLLEALVPPTTNQPMLPRGSRASSATPLG
jgi:hypothetical protein